MTFVVFHLPGATDSGVIESTRAINVPAATWTSLVICGVPTWSVTEWA